MKNMSSKKLDNPICALDYAFRRIGGKYKKQKPYMLSMRGFLYLIQSGGE
jgi:hypothetical protein